MRTPEQLEAVAVEAYGPYAAASVAEVGALVRELRILRHRLAILAERSDCGRTVRYAQRTLARDPLGAEGGSARDALGQPLRPLAWLEQALRGATGERAAVTPAELRALVAEWRRLRRALGTVAGRACCARSRDYAARALQSCSRKAAPANVRAVVGE
ncbi:MAG TPA: hypothetical protein VFL14_02965 [Xanthomonadales bacterium]|nr:hypothetical protein [Xanthomonadales bacterium]